MKTELFTLKNYSNWGELIKKWSADPTTRPKTPEEFEKQLIAANVQATFNPKDFTAVEFSEISGTMLSIRLPPAKMIEDALTELKASDYVLPAFYESAFGKPLKLTEEAARVKFHAARVGEYTIRFCG
jgi:hypothetical protein